MSFSYDSTAINANAKDRVRFELGDIDTDDPLLQDEEIAICLTDTSIWQVAVAKAARIIEARFRRLLEESVEDLKVEYTKRAEAWGKMRARFEELASEVLAAETSTASQAGMGFSAGGLPGSEGPYFRLGMHDYSRG